MLMNQINGQAKQEIQIQQSLSQSQLNSSAISPSSKASSNSPSTTPNTITAHTSTNNTNNNHQYHMNTQNLIMKQDGYPISNSGIPENYYQLKQIIDFNNNNNNQINYPSYTNNQASNQAAVYSMMNSHFLNAAPNGSANLSPASAGLLANFGSVPGFGGFINFNGSTGVTSGTSTPASNPYATNLILASTPLNTPNPSSASLNINMNDENQVYNYLHQLIDEREKLKELSNEPFNIILPTSVKLLEDGKCFIQYLKKYLKFFTFQNLK